MCVVFLSIWDSSQTTIFSSFLNFNARVFLAWGIKKRQCWSVLVSRKCREFKMEKIVYFILISCFGFTFIISCGDKDEYESWEKYGNKLSEDISISSSASDNATVTFGQTYQHQVTTTTYSGTITLLSAISLMAWLSQIQDWSNGPPLKPRKLKRIQILQLQLQQQAGMS